MIEIQRFWLIRPLTSYYRKRVVFFSDMCFPKNLRRSPQTMLTTQWRHWNYFHGSWFRHKGCHPLAKIQNFYGWITETGLSSGYRSTHIENFHIIQQRMMAVEFAAESSLEKWKKNICHTLMFECGFRWKTNILIVSRLSRSLDQTMCTYLMKVPLAYSQVGHHYSSAFLAIEGLRSKMQSRCAFPRLEVSPSKTFSGAKVFPSKVEVSVTSRGGVLKAAISWLNK